MKKKKTTDILDNDILKTWKKTGSRNWKVLAYESQGGLDRTLMEDMVPERKNRDWSTQNVNTGH